MKVCSSCGSEFEEEGPTCPQCGAAIPKPTRPNPFGVELPPVDDDEPFEEPGVEPPPIQNRPMPPPMPGTPIDPGVEGVCPNCGSALLAGIARCSNCGFGLGASKPGRRASVAEQIVTGILFIVVGVPLGMFGACAGMISVGSGKDAGPTFLLSLLGLGLSGLLLWLWIRSFRLG